MIDEGDEQGANEAASWLRLRKKINEEIAILYRQMSVGARKRRNLFVADKFLKLSLSSMASMRDNFATFHSLVKLYCLKAQQPLLLSSSDAETEASSRKESIDKFSKALKYVRDRSKDMSPQNPQKFAILEGGIYEALGNLWESNPKDVLASLQSMKLSTEMGNPDLKKLGSVLFSLAFNSYRQSTSTYASAVLASSSSSTAPSSVVNPKDVAAAAKAFFKFAYFCDEMVKREQESNNGKVSERTVNYAQMVITNTLQATLHSFPAARDYFPRLLEIASQIPQVQSIFSQQTKDIPVWMFIRWISQMVALLDKPEASLVLPILKGLAKEYPQAIYYPFRISSEGLSPAAQKNVKSLADLLRNHSLLETFVGSLETLTHPEHRWKDWIETIKPLLKCKGVKNTVDVDQVKRIGKEVWEDCFNPANAKGSYNKKFADTWANHFLTTFGKDLSKLTL
jgi:hypothetical protein